MPIRRRATPPGAPSDPQQVSFFSSVEGWVAGAARQGEDRFGIPSPIEQSRRHERILHRLLTTLGIANRSGAPLNCYRRHGSTLDDRRQAVRDLADVFEYLRPQVKSLLTSADEKDLFNIANNFGVRHHNDKQRTAYDAGIWLSWMFYFYLSTIHVVLRKIEQEARK